MTDASASVHHSVQNATILTTGVLLTERQLQILSSVFPHLAAKPADWATGVADVTSSSNTMMNYLAQYTMDLPSRAQQTPAEFWRQRDNGSVITLVALDLISTPALQAFVERLFSLCGMLTTGTPPNDGVGAPCTLGPPTLAPVDRNEAYCFHELVLNLPALLDIQWPQEAQLSPRDRAMRRVNWNLANCHETVQKLLIRQVLTE